MSLVTTDAEGWVERVQPLAGCAPRAALQAYERALETELAVVQEKASRLRQALNQTDHELAQLREAQAAVRLLLRTGLAPDRLQDATSTPLKRNQHGAAGPLPQQVHALMADGRWRTAAEVTAALGLGKYIRGRTSPVADTLRQLRYESRGQRPHKQWRLRPPEANDAPA